MKRLAVAAAGLLAFFACTSTPRPALDPTAARASVIELGFAVQVAAEQCSANARHLAHVDPKRADALFDACTSALIPARDAVVFVLPALDPWSKHSAPSVGCAGKAVRIGIEKVREAFLSAGYSGRLPDVAQDGIILGARVEPWAEESCDPLHPTAQTTTFVDPHIAPVEPDYPTKLGP